MLAAPRAERGKAATNKLTEAAAGSSTDGPAGLPEDIPTDLRDLLCGLTGMYSLQLFLPVCLQVGRSTMQ